MRDLWTEIMRRPDRDYPDARLVELGFQPRLEQYEAATVEDRYDEESSP